MTSSAAHMRRWLDMWAKWEIEPMARAFYEDYDYGAQQYVETMTQPKIEGYRQLSEAEVALINEGKALAEQCSAFCNKLLIYRVPVDQSPLTLGDGSIMQFSRGLGEPLDQRWINVGITHLQQGFMALTRSIAKPTTF
jgi:hypothetical protein